jgi:hypothetical protein
MVDPKLQNDDDNATGAAAGGVRKGRTKREEKKLH